jgi:hypothetical protein
MTETLPTNNRVTVYCSGCGAPGGYGFHHEFWMYAGPALEKGYSQVKLWTHYFCSHDCVRRWEAGEGARPPEPDDG